MKIKRLFSDLVTDNPMMAEISRFKSRYLSVKGSSAAVNGGVGILIFCFVLFTVICVYYRGDIPPIPLLSLYLFFAVLVIPLILHGAIAGERERRSWDMLMVAPITPAQIVIGKFAGAFVGMLVTLAIFLFPIFILAVFYSRTVWYALFLAILLVVAQLALIIATTIFISARVKRPLTALGISIGIIFVVFFLVPSASGFGSQSTGLLAINQPFSLIMILSRIGEPTYGYNDLGDVQALAPLIFATNLAFEFILTISLLAWTIKTISFADNEVKFLPKKKHARSQKSR